MNRKRISETILFVLLIASMLVSRLPDLTKFTAADEPFWLAVGGDYYYAITHHEFENTVYEYHPAVTTMWIVTGAMLIYFPEYRGLMNGYFQQEKSSFDTYLLDHGKNPLDLLWWCRFLQICVNISLFIVIFFLLQHMLNKSIAAMALLFVSFAPYLFGQSRMLNHESMVGLFSSVSLLAMIACLFQERQGAFGVNRKSFFLVLSAAAAAYANLTKSSSIVLFPVIVVVIIVWAVSFWKSLKWTVVGNAVKIFFAWLGILLFVYFISWPGMWVAPGKMLYEVYGNAFSYAFQGARLSVTQGLKPSNFNFASASSGFVMIFMSIAWRTTPVTWLGLLFSAVFFFNKNKQLVPMSAKYIMAFFLLEAITCISMFAFVQGRDQPHYVLTSYYCLEFCSAFGWFFVLQWLGGSFVWMMNPKTQIVLIGALFIIHAYPLIFTNPYYYTYLNPFMLATNDAPKFFYGEKMEEAASYLANKQGASKMTALVYFGRTFSYYYPGNTLVFKPVMFEDKHLLIEYLKKADYLVVYVGLHERLPLLKEISPEHVINLNGIPYVEIYRVSDIPADFYLQ